MRPGQRTARRPAAALRAVAFVLLAGSLLAPKVSLALATALGNGFTSVVVCTGGGLARVTLSPSGEIVDDVSERWASPHCVLNDDVTERLARSWQRTDWPRAARVVTLDAHEVATPPRIARLAVSSRGPPPAG